MSRLRLLLLVAAVVYAVLATWTLAGAQSPAPVARGDAKLGATMHDKDCVACHVRRLGAHVHRRVSQPALLQVRALKMTTALETLAAAPCVRSPTLADDATVARALAALPGWARIADRLAKTYRFANYHETIAFVNAIAWIAHRADHHPDLSVHFDRCVVSWSTHDAGGITGNDLTCAARVERLLA